MLKSYSGIDDASALLADPLILSTILFKTTGERHIIKRGPLHEVLEEIVQLSREARTQGKAVFAKLNTGSKTIRMLLISGTVVACVCEIKDQILLGDRAVASLVAESPSAIVSAWATYLNPLILDPSLRAHIDNAVEEFTIVLPRYWIGKSLYGLKIKQQLCDDISHNYVLLATDSERRRYVVKIPKEDSIVQKDTSSIPGFLRGSLNAAEVSSITTAELKTALQLRGIDPGLAYYLSEYRRYIAKPRLIAAPLDRYDTLEHYAEFPPVIVEEYADRGDLERLIYSKRLDEYELFYIGIRLAGALALAHLAHIVHMNIKPRNILLRSCNEELGYCPMITDFAGLTRTASRLFEAQKISLCFADPISLLRGDIGYDYDVYSLGMVLYFAYTGRLCVSRLAINVIIVTKLYRLRIDLNSIVKKCPEAELVSEVVNWEIPVSKDYGMEPVIRALKENFAELEKQDLNMLSTLPAPLRELIIRSITLNIGQRYQNALYLWLDMLRAARSSSVESLVPHPIPSGI